MRAQAAGTCITGKLRFPDERQAGIALAVTRAKRKRQGMPENRVEKRYYQCDLCRGGYHLTSKTLEQMRGEESA